MASERTVCLPAVSNAEKCRLWRQMKRKDPKYILGERERKVLYRKQRTTEQIEKDRETSRLRMQRYRREKTEKTTSPVKPQKPILTRHQKEAQRQMWHTKKQEYRKMTSKCGPCSFRAMDHDALVWCLVCKEGLCSDCKEYHTALKVSRSHEMIPYENLRKLPQIVRDIRETCLEHDRKFEIYCSDHQESCCIKCSTSSHKSCNNTALLDDVIVDVKSSIAMRHIEEELSGLISKTGTIIENKESSMNLVEDQTTNLKKDIQDMRERIEKTIGEQFKKIENKIDERKTEYETKTNDAITKLKENLTTAQNLRVTIAQIKESASNLQIFLFLKELESMVSKEENRLYTILEKGMLDNMTLWFIPSKQLETLVSVGCIGDIECETKPLDICFGSHGQSVMKIESKQSNSIDIDDVKLEKRTDMSFRDTSAMVANCVLIST